MGEMEQDVRDRILREMLGCVGQGVHIRPTFHCEYGTPISIGARTFVNFDCVMLDVAPITIGEGCQVATRGQFLTATHPTDPGPRRIGWEYAEPITLGDNVWLGGGVIVCPGVTIGDDTVVGLGPWSRATCPQASSPSGPRRGCCARSASATGSGCRSGELESRPCECCST